MDEASSNVDIISSTQKEIVSSVKKDQTSSKNPSSKNDQKYGSDDKCEKYTIQEEEAVQTAINASGLPMSEFPFLPVGLLNEYKNTCVYQITFKKNKVDYTYYIDAFNGSIAYQNVVQNLKIEKGDAPYIASQDLNNGMGTSPTTFSETTEITYQGVPCYTVTLTYEGISHVYIIRISDGVILSK